MRFGVCALLLLLLFAAATATLDEGEIEARSGGSASEGFHLDSYLGRLMEAAGAHAVASDAAAETEDGQRVVGVVALETGEQQRLQQRQRQRQQLKQQLKQKQKQKQKQQQQQRTELSAEADETAGVAAGAELKELLFHLDDALSEAARADNGQASGQRKVQKKANGGATSVVANRNYMSIMEDAEGRILDPKDAAKEARFQQVMQTKAKNRDKANEAREKKEKLEEENRARKAEEATKKQTLEMRSQTLEDEVKEAQEAAEKTNERNFKAFQRSKEQRAKEKQEQEQEWWFGDNWKNYGGHYGPATVDKRGNICYLSGLVLGRNGTIGKVPRICAPGQRIMFSVMRAGLPARVDMMGDGTMLLVEGVPHGWLSLSGIAYPADTANAERPRLVGGWAEYGLSWRPSSVVKDQDVCFVGGLIKLENDRAGNWTFFGQLPAPCRPDGRLVFSGCNHEHVTRVDVLPSGQFLKAGGYQEHGWVSLDGATFALGMGKPIDLLAEWKNYGVSYRPANYIKAGDICFVSGLVINDEVRWADIATLPGECRPRHREVFACNNHATSARVDVDVDGTIRYISGRTEHNWLSLSCIHFVAASPVNQPVDIVQD